jgi:hypothetical protein
MKRRLNYTGRRRIPRESISIALVKGLHGGATSFNANLDLASLNLQPDNEVYIEAYHRNELKRFSFGTVGDIRYPPDTLLTDFPDTENLRFRVLVVDRSAAGKIVAHVDRIAIEADSTTKAILPVDLNSDLGQQVWCVAFEGPEDSPILRINNKIPNRENMARSDPQFIMNIYPSALKEILIRMIFIDGVSDVNDPSVEWHRDWLNFSRKQLAEDFPQAPYNPEDNGNPAVKEDWLRWVDKVVAEFCLRRREWWDYMRVLDEGE